MQRALSEIDIHAVWMLILFAPGLLLSIWWVIPMAVIPQGRILVRAIRDYPRFGKRTWPYLVINEAVVFGVLLAFVWTRMSFGTAHTQVGL